MHEEMVPSPLVRGGLATPGHLPLLPCTPTRRCFVYFICACMVPGCTSL